MQSEQRSSDTTKYLTYVGSRLYKRIMPRKQDVVHALREQLEADAAALHKILDEQNSLRAAHIRFMDLEDEARQKMPRLKRLAVLLTCQGQFDIAKKTKPFGIAEVDVLADVLKEIPLWEAIAEILRQTGELQVVDLNQLLNEIVGQTSRQAIDSALATHSKEFQIKRRARETFVSLRK